MDERLWSLILYPALADGLTEGQRKILLATGAGRREMDSESFLTAVTSRPSLAVMQNLAAQIPGNQKETFYAVAEQIATEGGLSDPEALALQELQRALGLASAVAGVDRLERDIDLQVAEQEFHQIALKYSRLAAALGFLPLPYFDAVGIVSLQTRMVTKIAGVYNFELPAKQFVSMVFDKVGLGCGLVLLGEELLHLVPVLGWTVSAGLIFEATYAMAIVTRRYIELGGNMGDEDLKETYQGAYDKVKRDLVEVKKKTLAAKDKLVEKLKEYCDELAM